MRLIVEIDLEAGAIPSHEDEELGRILRYWAGNLKHYELTAGIGEDIYDSGYAKVGRWRVEG